MIEHLRSGLVSWQETSQSQRACEKKWWEWSWRQAANARVVYVCVIKTRWYLKWESLCHFCVCVWFTAICQPKTPNHHLISAVAMAPTLVRHLESSGGHRLPVLPPLPPWGHQLCLLLDILHWIPLSPLKNFPLTWTVFNHPDLQFGPRLNTAFPAGLHCLFNTSARRVFVTKGTETLTASQYLQ